MVVNYNVSPSCHSRTKSERSICFMAAANALGIGAASFWSVAEKDIAESPTAIAGTPKINL